jgi:alpha-L-fucosidase 2
MFALCGKALQVDGSLGMTAAITEMLMQSQDGSIDLLPALPDEWSSGEFNGVCARGGFELAFKWADKTVTVLKVTSKTGGTFRLKTNRPVQVMTFGKIVGTFSPSNGVVQFPTSRGITYDVRFR